jgi:hypothetical protein
VSAPDPAPDRDPYADFTTAAYADVCRAVKERYRLLRFTDDLEAPGTLWRHDVDVSVVQAARIARLEADLGIVSTYFFLPHSRYYNLWAPDTVAAARGIVALGHDAGLHFDPTFYDDHLVAGHYEELAAAERAWLVDLLHCPVAAVSFHQFGVLEEAPPDGAHVAGMVNAYSATIRDRFRYVSDSNGVWRFDRLVDVVAEGRHDHLHVLTHPVWWSTHPLPPRRRLQLCIDEAAQTAGDWYDDLTARYGRPNIDVAGSGDTP